MNESMERVNLDPLDPGSKDPGFWLRFHGRVLAQAEAELARRRMAQDWSLSEVVFQWRKPLVPLTLLAATLAGIFVMANEEPGPLLSPVALEEALVLDVVGEPIPTVLGSAAELDETEFLTAAGGFRP
ncbi:MAG: hypothetical protein HKO65_12025 [Gemmatimonadetes bacterium]|nr:hypothetical protein [Gemmatimonadota bacterium]NNM05807.1 hypothetical protein [Gemmatimonadota bacterium]